MGGVIDGEVPEWHVADDRGETAVGHAGGFESFQADLGRRIQVGGDGGGDRVVLHSDHLRLLGRQTDESS